MLHNGTDDAIIAICLLPLNCINTGSAKRVRTIKLNEIALNCILSLSLVKFASLASPSPPFVHLS